MLSASAQLGHDPWEAAPASPSNACSHTARTCSHAVRTADRRSTTTARHVACPRPLAYISGYICGQGSTASGAGFLVDSSNKRLGKVQMPNSNVEAIFLCRNYDVGSFTTGLNGYILQNTITGNACFFDARSASPAASRSGAACGATVTAARDSAGVLSAFARCAGARATIA